MNIFKFFAQKSKDPEDKICRCEHIVWCDINDKCMKEKKDERTETTLPTDRRS
jgi:hypothetical protein